MRARTAAAASLSRRVATATTSIATSSSSSSVSRPAAAVRRSSTSAELLRWSLGARGQGVVASEVDQTRGCRVQPVEARRSIWTTTEKQGQGRDRDRDRRRGKSKHTEDGSSIAAEDTGVFGKLGKETSSVVGIGSGTQLEVLRGNLEEAEGRKMYTPVYPSYATYYEPESGSATEPGSSYPPQYPQQHQHQYRSHYEVRDNPIAQGHLQTQAQAQTQTQTQTGVTSTPFAAHYAANSSPWPVDPRYNPIAHPGPLFYSPPPPLPPPAPAPVGWTQEYEDEMQRRRRMGYFGAPAPAARATAPPVHGHYGMQVLPPAHTSSASGSPHLLPSSPSGPYTHAYLHAHSYHPYAPGSSSSLHTHTHTHTHTRMQPHHPPGGALHFSSSTYQNARHPDAGNRQVLNTHPHAPSVPPPQPPRNVTSSSYTPRPEYTPTHPPRIRSVGPHQLNAQQGHAPQLPPKPPQEGLEKQQQQKKKKKKKKPEISTLPPYSFLDRNPRAKVLYVRTAIEADRAVVALRAALKKDPVHNQVVGFDLEWRPKFLKGQPENPVALVQLATRDLIVLAQVSAMGTFPEKLKNLLEDSDIFKAGVSIISDSRKLSRDHGVSVHSCIELSYFAKCIERQKWKGGFQDMIGLSRLVQAYLLNSLPKGSVQTSNWELKLSNTQQKYAANDAHCGLMVFYSLLAMANKMDADVLPDPSYYSFDVIGQKVLNGNGDAWVPCSPYPEEQPSDEESLSEDESPSGRSSLADTPVHELDSEEEAALLDLIARQARKLRA